MIWKVVGDLRWKEIQAPEDKQVTFMDLAMAQRTVGNQVLEKIHALVDLKRSRALPGGDL
jgi:hypothetical protein